MPIYSYLCNSCYTEMEEYKKIEERNSCPRCKCGGKTHFIFSKVANPYISGYPYYDGVLETTINDPAQRKKLLKENRLTEKG